MDINQLLKGLDCKCGRHHDCAIESVYIEKGACLNLKSICKDYKKALMVADENTYSASGEKVVSALSDKQIEKVIFSGKKVLVPDEIAIQTVEQKLDGVDIIVGVGSGVIQDLCKCVSHYNKIPYLIVATAPSMDGYASDGAAMILKGMKDTVKAGLPKAILADLDVLCECPLDMIKAGYGDVIGKFSALNDWKIANVINGEYFCDFIFNLTFEQVQKTLKLADGLLLRNPESVKSLMEALVLIGILMSFAGSSRPASGSEHHLSHFFEITGIVEDKPYLSHGLDVAYSTVITSMVREKLLKADFSNPVTRESEQQKIDNVKRVYTKVAEECIALQNRIGNYADRSSIYKQKEQEIKRVLAQVPTANEIQQMLALADLDIKEFYSLYGTQKIKDAVKYAKDLKDRFTVLWLYYDILGGDLDV